METWGIDQRCAFVWGLDVCLMPDEVGRSWEPAAPLKTSQKNIFQNKVCKDFPGKVPSVWLNHRGRTRLLLWMSAPDLSGNWVNYASNSGTRSCSWIRGQAKQTRHGDGWKSGSGSRFMSVQAIVWVRVSLGFVQQRGARRLRPEQPDRWHQQKKGAFPVLACWTLPATISSFQLTMLKLIRRETTRGKVVDGFK